MLSEIIEAIIGGWFGAKQPRTREEKKIHRIVSICVVVFMLGLLIFWTSE